MTDIRLKSNLLYGVTHFTITILSNNYKSYEKINLKKDLSVNIFYTGT